MTTDKPQLRARLLADRAALSAETRRAAGQALTEQLLSAPEVTRAEVVAGYVGVGTEPPTLPLLNQLHDRGARVLLPVLRADDDLDWADFTGEAGLVQARRGLLEPSGPRLGVEAVCAADVMLCPGLAVGRGGIRLGRGGGSYDRALSRLASAGATDPGVWTCTLLFDHEVLDAVPADPHDRPVRAVATPSGVTRFR